MTGFEVPEDLLRNLAPQVLGAVVRRFGHFDLAEDAVQEALLAAATSWPADGLPDNPRSWLVAVAGRKLTDLLRSEQARRAREERYALLTAGTNTQSGGPEEDDTLVLLFLCCHPSLTPASQIALTLRAVGGLTTAEIARAFMVPEATMTRRITRAKQTVATSGQPFALPSPADRDQRLAAVLHTLYLVFTEGYATTAGQALTRVELTTEAIRLTRMLHRLLPDEPEVAGLLALMVLTDARRAARTSSDGTLVPMAEQDRGRWDRDLIAEGVALITETLPRGPVGPYQLQAAIAALHDEAATAAETDWPQILALYEVLLRLGGNPVVALNHAVAAAMVHGPQTGLDLLEPLTAEDRLREDHRLYAVRAHLLEQAGQAEEARQAYRDAADRARNLQQQRYLNGRAARL
ncbi:MAG: sigma-70 family RNA polymerase sigma factor [Hamadaea sp.]|uniref:RNA polymerase sigma factor n=1 Tax=Hamadaea sp. TaxID=2024425 RepID=UPI001820861F|nr:sigma-70 family RNA polymerase sigma factor [Hamadaea sp.]NUT23369.1 sigma-70 family RNA polymerase sigma factor [Hamadaea sp.]